MVRGRSGARRGPCCYFLIVASAAAVIITSSGADARHHSSDNRINRDESANRRNTHAQEYLPPSASIVVDGNSGAVLEASNPDALRHPASLTKIMTLYLLFERLERGRIHLDTPLKVSEHASKQAPTKLGLQAGQTITVEDAIKSMVTKSANDAAVVVAENLGGDEGNFAKLMTQRARALGMIRTTYMNASGLPDDDQVTTARDQALLGRAIQEHFPRRYKYFSTESFVYHGETMRNHNHLLGSIEGVDGIKTGFTHASGFNLVTSVHRGGRYLVAVVMGGHSSFDRPYARTNQRAYQASRSPAHGARHCPAWPAPIAGLGGCPTGSRTRRSNPATNRKDCYLAGRTGPVEVVRSNAGIALKRCA